jgi:hypothetical protein
VAGLLYVNYRRPMRRQLRTWLPRVAMLAVLAGAAAGCGGSDSDGEGPAEPQTTSGGGATTTTAGQTTTTVVPPPTELPTTT